jgi:hypothetical protein
MRVSVCAANSRSRITPEVKDDISRARISFSRDARPGHRDVIKAKLSPDDDVDFIGNLSDSAYSLVLQLFAF